MKQVIVKKYPSSYYSDYNTALVDAERHGVNVCIIILEHEWNGEVSQDVIGYGLYDNRLLETSDFIHI